MTKPLGRDSDPRLHFYLVLKMLNFQLAAIITMLYLKKDLAQVSCKVALSNVNKSCEL